MKAKDLRAALQGVPDDMEVSLACICSDYDYIPVKTARVRSLIMTDERDEEAEDYPLRETFVIDYA